MRRLLALNAALAASAACAAATALPGEMRMLGAALVVLVLPGLAWSGLFRATPLSPARLAVAVIGLSAISLSGGLAVGAVFAPPPSPWPFLVWTLVATNLGAVWSGGLPKLDPGRPWLALGAVALAGFLATAGAALRLVPPLEDHDMEVRGTAYGLASDLKPYFTSNREQFLPMSHPLLFNAIVTGTLLVTHEIDAVKPSYDSAKRAEEAARNGAPFSWEASWRSDYEAFLARPALAGTRAASALFAGLVLALIVDALLRLTGSAAAAGAGAFLYAAAPETIVRSAYAGYFAETVFAMLVAAMVLGEDDAGRAWPAAAGALMALLDHKTAVFAGAVAAWAAALALRTRQAPDARAIALALGFGAGTLGWWAYGLWVSPRAFVDDHIRKHLVHRFLLNDVRFAADHVNRYAPSIPELWREFAAHTGWTLVPIAVLASIAALVRPGSAVATALAVWFLSGAVAFSLTDWRQTKHLMNGLAPMVILAVAAAWPLVRWRRLTAALLLAACLANLAIDRKLLADFHSLRVSGASDIDGW